MRPGLARPLRIVIAAALALEGAWLVAANVALNTGWVPGLVSRDPARLTLRWRSAWTPWPGMVGLRGVEVRGRSRRIEWYASLDAVTFTFAPLPLFRHTVDLATVKAAGVDYRQRRRPMPGVTSPIPASELPPIPGFPEQAEPGAIAPGPPRPRRAPWTILADRIVCDVNQLWIDRFRVIGPMRVETPMRLLVRGPMEFPNVKVRMASGVLRAGDGTIFDHLGLEVDATIHPFVPKNARGLAFFRNMSGRYVFRSDSASLFFLEPYFKKAPWLRFKHRAAGRADLRLDHGRLLPGTTFEVRNDRIDMEIIDRRLTGRGVITGLVNETTGVPRSTVTVSLMEFQLAPLEDTTPYARGHAATVVATSTSLDLGNPFTDLHVVLDLPGAEILDASFYNAMIPPDSGFRIVSGTGSLRYHLEGSHEERSLHGDITLTLTNMVAGFQNYDLHGDLRIDSLLRESSIPEKRFDISGTRIALHADRFDWSAVIGLPRATMQFSQPPTIDATIRLEMDDTRPLVTLYDALKGVPDWIQKMLVIRNIRGGAVLAVRHERVDVTDLDITGKGLHALADLTLGKKGRGGILYIRFHGFSVGIDLKNGDRNLKIVRPLYWFQTERARRGGGAKPPP